MSEFVFLKLNNYSFIKPITSSAIDKIIARITTRGHEDSKVGMNILCVMDNNKVIAPVKGSAMNLARTALHSSAHFAGAFSAT